MGIFARGQIPISNKVIRPKPKHLNVRRKEEKPEESIANNVAAKPKSEVATAYVLYPMNIAHSQDSLHNTSSRNTQSIFNEVFSKPKNIKILTSLRRYHTFAAIQYKHNAVQVKNCSVSTECLQPKHTPSIFSVTSPARKETTLSTTREGTERYADCYSEIGDRPGSSENSSMVIDLIERMRQDHHVTMEDVKSAIEDVRRLQLSYHEEFQRQREEEQQNLGMNHCCHLMLDKYQQPSQLRELCVNFSILLAIFLYYFLTMTADFDFFKEVFNFIK